MPINNIFLNMIAVLEQYCLPEDVFERLNHELMVSDNLISFLVNVKKYLMT